MAKYLLECLPAGDGVAIAPCGTVSGIGYAPQMVEGSANPEIDFTNSDELYVWAFSMLALAWFLGLTIGLIMKVIKSA